jgi:predicted ATPase/transcriptional regulator with XRE-family HTH domain
MVDIRGLRDFLLEQRRAAGWTQEELAERSHLSVRTIRNLEAGSINNPRRTSIELLIDAFGSAFPHTVNTTYPGSTMVRLPVEPSTTRIDTGDTGARGDDRNWRGRAPVRERPVGRDTDLRHITDAIRDYRLVVLTGPGGVGKTRLALAAADELSGHYRDGVTVAELGRMKPDGPDCTEALERIRHVVASACSAHQAEGDDLPAGLQMLLVLDNAEHVIGSATRLVRRLLEENPGLRIIVTSRRPLSIVSAHVWEVGPLALDDPASVPAAVELFLRRAHASCPTLDLHDRIPEITELCHRLDGLPLAIELAAYRIRSVPLDAMLRDGPLAQLLGEVTSGGLPHQRTLLGSVRWSHELLGPEQRGLLAHLAHSPEPFTIEDVESYSQCSDGDTPDVVNLFAELVEASLVVVQRDPQYTYRLLRFIREYVNEA